MTYLSRPHADAWLAVITAAATPFAVGDGQAPDEKVLQRDSDGILIQPYAVYYDLGSPTFDGSLDGPDLDSDGWSTAQVTCVGTTRIQAQDLHDLIGAGIDQSELTVQGRLLSRIRPLEDVAPQRDDDVRPPLFYAIARYRAYSTPA